MDERSSSAVVESRADRPEFAALPLDTDAETAVERIHETLSGLTAAETPEGLRFRTLDGMLVAVLHEADDGTVEFHYRTAPASEPATRKARKLREALAADRA